MLELGGVLLRPGMPDVATSSAHHPSPSARFAARPRTCARRYRCSVGERSPTVGSATVDMTVPPARLVAVMSISGAWLNSVFSQAVVREGPEKKGRTALPREFRAA